MDKIASFKVNHMNLLTGVYVSRQDRIGELTITTFDLRFTRPNFEKVMETAGIHTIEHMGATFLRNHPKWKDSVIYFGPMGCRTGFYLILVGELAPADIIPVLREMAEYVAGYEGDIPGYSPKDCGNYLDNDLAAAKLYMAKFAKEVLENPTGDRMIYPE